MDVRAFLVATRMCELHRSRTRISHIPWYIIYVYIYSRNCADHPAPSYPIFLSPAFPDSPNYHRARNSLAVSDISGGCFARE